MTTFNPQQIQHKSLFLRQRNVFVRMKKAFYAILFLMFACITTNAQNKEKLLKYYTYGLPAYRGCDMECMTEIAKKYGFENVTKAGCVVKPGQVRRWERHNKKVDKKLIARNGEGWKEKYNADFTKQCCQQKKSE